MRRIAVALSRVAVLGIVAAVLWGVLPVTPTGGHVG